MTKQQMEGATVHASFIGRVMAYGEETCIVSLRETRTGERSVIDWPTQQLRESGIGNRDDFCYTEYLTNDGSLMSSIGLLPPPLVDPQVDLARAIFSMELRDANATVGEPPKLDLQEVFKAVYELKRIREAADAEAAPRPPSPCSWCNAENRTPPSDHLTSHGICDRHKREMLAQLDAMIQPLPPLTSTENL